MLILFDIDGTLLLTQGAGIRSMEEAGRELFGSHFTVEGVEFSGRLDPLIYRDLATKNRVNDPDRYHDPFRRHYHRILDRRLRENRTARALSGAFELIDALRRQDDVVIGLLTGNYPETGALKIAAAGYDRAVFSIAAWGTDGATRRNLPAAAMSRFHEAQGREIDPASVVIIGDTPHDVDCARFAGCRVLGVATGAFSCEQLASCGADLAIKSLRDTDTLLDWLLKPQSAGAQ